jgi:RHS repeat-associated protein
MLGNGLVQTWDYSSPLQRLAQLRVGPSGSLGGRFDRSYGYDNTGNVTSVADSWINQTQQFRYDARDRLIQAWTTSTPFAPLVYATDTFNRSKTDTWGNAETGGAYSYSGTQADFDVTNGVGTMNVPASSQSRSAWLASVPQRDVDSVVTVTTDKTPAGGNQRAHLLARRQASGNVYSGRISFEVDGAVYLKFYKTVGGSDTDLGVAVQIPGVNYTGGTRLRVRFQAAGANPTMLRAKAWIEGQPEPYAWQAQITDGETSLQGSGAVGLRSTLSGGQTNAPILFRYDDYRVSAPYGAQPADYNESYSYNALGNLTSKAGRVYSYGDGAHIHAVTSDGLQSYNYDANGNMTGSSSGRKISWNQTNQPVSVTSGGVTETYGYDGDGVRVKKVVGSTTTIYLEGVWEEVGGAQQAYYVVGERPIAVRDTSGVVYLHSDHLGSVSVATNAQGLDLSRQEYDPWGQVRAGSVPQTSRNFTGQRRDATGLLDYQARLYDPALGRFISADSVVPGGPGGSLAGIALKPLTVAFGKPALLDQLAQENRLAPWFQLSAQEQQQAGTPWGPSNPQALNRYSYVLNNPVRWTDPSGHDVFQFGISYNVALPILGPLGVNVSGSVGVAIDTLGNSAIYTTQNTIPVTGLENAPGAGISFSSGAASLSVVGSHNAATTI